MVHEIYIYNIILRFLSDAFNPPVPSFGRTQSSSPSSLVLSVVSLEGDEHYPGQVAAKRAGGTGAGMSPEGMVFFFGFSGGEVLRNHDGWISMKS